MKLKLNAGTHICLTNGKYDVTIRPDKTFDTRAQFDGFVRRECRLLAMADEQKVREQYEAKLVEAE